MPTLEQKAEPEMLYWVGCAVAFDPRAQKIARSMAAILNAAGIDWAVIGKEEKCTGDTARRTGNEYLFAQMAEENVNVLNEIKPKTIVTTCPHCFHTIANEYPQFGGKLRCQASYRIHRRIDSRRHGSSLKALATAQSPITIRAISGGITASSISLAR